MSLTIELSPDEQARLDAAAKEKGMAPEVLAREVLTSHLPAAPDEPATEDPTLALFRRWAEEDAQRTPEEVAEENELWERFQANVNETRAALGMRLL